MKKIIMVILSFFIINIFCGCGEYKVEKERNVLAGETLKFSGKDLDGNIVTQDIFNDYDLIIINKWGTFCNPCVQEMPDIQKIQDKFNDKKVKVIGVISINEKKDDEKSLIDDAKKITDVKKINYLNILPDKTLNKQLNKFTFVPVTIFVKPNGKVLDTYIVGNNNYDYFEKLTEAILNGEVK